MPCRGIRGAITIANNSREEIIEGTKTLLRRIAEANGVLPEDLACIIFTTTSDLNAEFPALAARELGWTKVPLLCAREIEVPGSIRRCIRVLLLWNTEKEQEEIVHVYLGEAERLRPDLYYDESKRRSEGEGKW